jgi:hypothetical protein
VPAPTVSGEPRVALQIVRPATLPSLRIDEATRRQLRALGYAE